MARVTDLPDELILQIFRYNVPASLTLRLDLFHHIHKHIISQRLYTIAKDAFYHEFAHDIEIILPHVEGMLLGRVNFVKRIRKVRIRTSKLWTSCIDVAIVKLLDGTAQYDDLGEIEVIIQDRYCCRSLGAGSKISETLVQWQKSRERSVKVEVRAENQDLLRKKQT